MFEFVHITFARLEFFELIFVKNKREISHLYRFDPTSYIDVVQIHGVAKTVFTHGKLLLAEITDTFKKQILVFAEFWFLANRVRNTKLSERFRVPHKVVVK